MDRIFHIIIYQTESPGQFATIQSQIAERLQAALSAKAGILTASELSPTLPVQGLDTTEIACLIAVAETLDSSNDSTSAYIVRQSMENTYTKIATTLALRSLRNKQMIEETIDADYNGNEFASYKATEQGFAWLMHNKDSLTLLKDTKKPRRVDDDDSDPFAEE